MEHFSIRPNLLSKDDPRYIHWRKSLSKRPVSWNKGKTKDTDSSVKKISETFKKKRINNFASWRKEKIAAGELKADYPPFEKTSDLATLVGLVLGDGHIAVFPRTERLEITLGTDKPKLIDFVFQLMEKVFSKTPIKRKDKNARCVKVGLYEKFISKRLGVPTGNRRYSTSGIPKWIWQKREHLIGCLKGLFEAEGSLSIHLPTCTYNFAFANRNEILLDDVRRALTLLGLHPEARTVATRIRRKHEVKYFQELISFRKY